MATCCLQLPEAPKQIRSGHIPLGGVDPAGNRLDVNGYHLELNGQPFFAISGEFHFSRYDERYWDDELLKMAMGGINIVSTYVFWIHHEEIQGQFDWEGRKSLRRFVELCGKRGLRVIIRIGPWCHGEVRNGGFPDWLYGRPFDVRSDDEEYLGHVRTLYRQIAEQVKGLLYKDGGPIIGAQLENEYMHAGAPWERTTGVSDEWVSGGRDGEAHILALKRLAQEAGIDTPLYTCTAWGGAAAPVPHVLPLWGGYAFQPWIFYGSVNEHPATPEYIFRDHHNDAMPKTYNFEPQYRPEDYPYACCEMGGGMQVYYRYRFQLPPESIEAMAIVKAAGGCNFLGYYMFHGGTNPYGKRTPFLNEHAIPKLSYDYQAALGEFGQLRGHYQRLKLLHLFFSSFEDRFCRTRTVLPYDTTAMDPRDIETPRYAARSDGSSGFLFLNNYQDHLDTKDHEGLIFELQFQNSALRIPHSGGLTLKKDVSCILPFCFDLDGVTLKYATAQLITRLTDQEGAVMFAFSPEGMEGEYCFDAAEIADLVVTGGTARRVGNEATGVLLIVKIDAGRTGVVRMRGSDGKVRTICALTREDGLRFWKAKLRGAEYVFISEGAVLSDESPSGEGIRLECAGMSRVSLKTVPPLPEDISIANGSLLRKAAEPPFACYEISLTPAESRFSMEKVGKRKVILEFEEAAFARFKQVILKVDYSGDIGNAYIDGRLIADNFCNGTPWEIELTRHRDELLAKGMYIDIVPIKKGARVVHDTSMAARYQVSDEEIGEIETIRAVGVRDVTIR